MTTAQIERQIKRLQDVQKRNAPSTLEWQGTSEAISKLITLRNGWSEEQLRASECVVDE